MACAVVAVTVAAGSAVMAGCSTTKAKAVSSPAKPSELTTSGSAYVVPDPLPKGQPGDAIATQRAKASAAIPDAVGTRMLYRTTDRTGRAVAASGIVYVPASTAPKGGWPVVAWGHGTAGVADRCAPSLSDNLFYNEYAQIARAFLRAGYAVVAPDYIGLGTPGLHAYLHGAEEGNAMVDAVIAARQIHESLSPSWFAVGHSQGGQAALFAAQESAARQTGRGAELHLKGAVAIAPASGLQLAVPAIVGGGVPADIVYGTYLLAGLSAVDPTVTLTDTLGPEGQRNLGQIVEQGCLIDTLVKLRDVPIDKVFSLTPEQAADLSARVAKYGNPENRPLPGPALVVQGETDHDIPLGLTTNMVNEFDKFGTPVEFKAYPDLNHDTVLGPATCDILDWMHRHGGPTPGPCTPEPTDLS